MTEPATITPVQIALFLAFQLLAVVAVVLVRRLWRGEPTPFVGMQVDLVRSLPFVVVAGVAFVDLLLVIAVFGSTERATAVGVIGVILVLPLMIVLPALATTLWLRGWPAALVPPHLRGAKRTATYRPDIGRGRG